MTPEEKNDQGGAAPDDRPRAGCVSRAKLSKRSPSGRVSGRASATCFSRSSCRRSATDIDADPGARPDGREGESVGHRDLDDGQILAYPPGHLAVFHVGRKIVEAVKPMQATTIDVGDYNAPKSDEAGRRRRRRRRQKHRRGEQGQAARKDKGSRSLLRSRRRLKSRKLPEPPAINVQKDIQLPDNPTCR